MSGGRLFIIDPSYATRTGHNHAANTLLAEEAQKHGIGVGLFAHAALPGTGDAVRAFRTTAYNFFPANDIDALRLSAAIAQDFFEDLRVHVQPLLLPDDVLLLHTANNPVLHGFASWFRALPDPAACRVRIGLMLPPDFRQGEPEIARFNRQHYRFCFEMLAEQRSSIKYYVETQQMEDLFLHLGAHPISRNRPPSRVEFSSYLHHAGQENRPTVLFVPGEIRAEKGHEFIINGMIALARLNPAWLGKIRIRFTAVAMPDHVTMHLSQFPNLFEIVPEREISNERYWELLCQADGIVCTYDPKEYSHRGSNIFFEAMAAGIPALVSSGTSLEQELAENSAGAGLVVEYGNVDSLAEALQHVLAHADELSANARKVMKKYQHALSATHYLDWLMSE